MQLNSFRIGSLIGRILLKRYPGAASSAFEVTFEDLMEWDFWPCFVNITCKEKQGDFCGFCVFYLSLLRGGRRI